MEKLYKDESTAIKTKVTEEETWIWQFLPFFFSLLTLIENKNMHAKKLCWNMK